MQGFVPSSSSSWSSCWQPRRRWRPARSTARDPRLELCARRPLYKQFQDDFGRTALSSLHPGHRRIDIATYSTSSSSKRLNYGSCASHEGVQDKISWSRECRNSSGRKAGRKARWVAIEAVCSAGDNFSRQCALFQNLKRSFQQKFSSVLHIPTCPWPRSRVGPLWLLPLDTLQIGYSPKLSEISGHESRTKPESMGRTKQVERPDDDASLLQVNAQVSVMARGL